MHAILRAPPAFNAGGSPSGGAATSRPQQFGPRSMNIKNRREELMRISRDNHVSYYSCVEPFVGFHLVLFCFFCTLPLPLSLTRVHAFRPRLLLAAHLRTYSRSTTNV